ncbi:hypothetical protein NUK32_21515, partial [Aeromonas caviae]|uniref:hypothetical protein n=1 Tax=Aeromonas caviae TaxID=648 RepID=UPI002324ECAF|nr:hypothetical protein [Aeromonas caviae]
MADSITAPVSAFPAGLSEAEVIEWLKQNPDLLARHPDLCEILLPPTAPRGGDNVVDLQRFMVQRLQG